MNYNKLLLDELRSVTYEKIENCKAALTEELLAKAVTLNENLQSLGYVLSPVDLAALAVSPSLDGFYDKVRSMMDEVPAEPMYPGFPKQVMEMDEAVFRFHQMVHYFSTYGMELLFGAEVKHGWLPEEGDNSAHVNAGDAPANGEKSSRLEPMKMVLSAKTIKLLPADESYLTPLRLILSRKERMTLPEMVLVSAAIAKVAPSDLAKIRIGFKENMNLVYGIVFGMENREEAFSVLRGMCQHTGDVMRCVDILLVQNKFHFRTSQKRFLVKLLESYSAKDFRANLVLSGKGAERNILLLNYLDYSVYSRSADHLAAVNALRDGKLRSWESIAKSMLASGDAGALDFVAQRPGMMLRMVAWLVRLGYKPEDITARLAANASALSGQTLVTILNHFGKLLPEECENAEQLYGIFEDLLSARMHGLDTLLRGKKVMFKMDEFDLGVSQLNCNDKSAEGGFIRSGIAYKLPEGVDRLRFFVYWNDEKRVDVDLHAAFTDLNTCIHTVGWNSSFRDCGVVHSGDITHSDAAEYIDIDLTAPVDKVFANIHLFSGRDSFKDVETCYVGMMAVPEGASDVKQVPCSQDSLVDDLLEDNSLVESSEEKSQELYSEANCFFRYNLRQACCTMSYGYVDVKNRCLVFDGAPVNHGYDWYHAKTHRRGRLSLARYLDLLLVAQKAETCESEEEADVVLVLGQPGGEKEVSLTGENFFLE